MLVLLSCVGTVPLVWDSKAPPATVDTQEDSPPEQLPSDTHEEETADTVETGDSGELPEWTEPERVPDVIVDCNGSGDYRTIGEAIASSVSGTKIGLKPCTYHEDVNFDGKALDIFGMEGSGSTTIEGTGTTAVIIAIRGESIGTRLAGVTVTGGRMTDSYGSGLYAWNAVLTLEDVVFTGAADGYSVLYTSGAFVEMIDVTITENHVTTGGYGIVVDNGSMVGQRFSIDCDDLDYGIYEHNSLMLLDSEVRCGNAYGVIISGGELHLRRSTVTSPGMGIYGEDNDDTRNERLWIFNSGVVGENDGAVYSAYMHVKVDNSTFWGGKRAFDMEAAHAESYVYNSIAVGSRCGINTDGAGYALGWNAIEGDKENCNADGFATIVGDPMLVDPPEDLSLDAMSPARDAGDPAKDHEDADESRCDIGMFGGPDGGGW